MTCFRICGGYQLLLVLLGMFFVTDVLLAGPTGTLAGRVTDVGSTIIPGVKIEAINLETTVTYSSETNKAGFYILPNLPSGTYRIIALKFGFLTTVDQSVTVPVQMPVVFNFQMEVGSSEESVTIQSGAPLIQSDPQRGGNFDAPEVQNLPLISLNPISLARTLPGVIAPAGSYLYGIIGAEATEFSVNGQRPRGNNYLLDSTENNDIAFTGVAQHFNMTDAVEEVSVQTGNFGAEFGRAGGGIFNVVTKSGTESFHGTMLWRYQSQRFNSVSNVDKLNQTPRSGFSENNYGFTAGGPIRSHKTFFFVGYQHDNSRQKFSLVVPTDVAVTTLRSLFPSNADPSALSPLDLYLKYLGNLRGVANPIGIPLGKDPVSGRDRGTVQFASAPLELPSSAGEPQWLVRLDHNVSESHHLSLRYIDDSHTVSPAAVYFPGFYLDQSAQNRNLLFTDQYAFSSAWTNEFRFSYAKQANSVAQISPESIPEARTLPRIIIDSVDSPGVDSGLLQHRKVNNFLYQEAQTKLSGRHTFRYGVEFLRQLATQDPYTRSQGQYTFNAAPSLGYSAFANFLDDFSGPNGQVRKDFGATAFHPNQFHQTYYLQDRWLPVAPLSMTFGLRYENFGQPANALKYPAFSGFDPDDFLKPNKVNTDNNNFGPAFGLAWAPSFQSGWLGKIFGAAKTVWRGGYQISYDAFFTQMIALSLATSSPNAISLVLKAPNTGRGRPGWYEQLLPAPSEPSVTDSQQGALAKDLRTPYTERWSFGFQREFSHSLVVDGSYVGSESHKLTTWEDVNPRLPSGLRLYPDFGQRQIRASDGNSSYHSMQWRVDRRFPGGSRLTASYTWSRNLDSTSDGVATNDIQNLGMNETSVPVADGGLRLDHGPSNYDRTQSLTVLFLWNIPGPAAGIWKGAIGGWSMTGIASFQSGAPFTVLNGFDRNNDGIQSDRPDIGNPAAPLNSRAILASSCSSGYLNPDTNSCVNPSDVHWVEGTGMPNASTVGRNTLHAGGINNLDLSLSKAFDIGNQRRLEFRWDAFNALNHPQFTQIPDATVLDSFTPQAGIPSRFLNRNYTDSGIRTMWMQLKLVF